VFFQSSLLESGIPAWANPLIDNPGIRLSQGDEP